VVKKEQTVGTRLPDPVFSGPRSNRTSRASRPLEDGRKLLSRAIQEWKLDHYSRLYGRGKLTPALAAREAGVSLWEMMDCVKTRKITAQYGLEDVERDLKTVVTGEKPVGARSGLRR
jgi:predicted HTH domain antitoxin